MTQEEKNKLEQRLSKLESNRNLNLWLQFLVFPLILGLLGYYFQNTIQNSQKRIEQLKMSQEIVNSVFNDTNYGKTVAMRQILNEVLENDELSKKIGKEIDKRLENVLFRGNPQDAENVLDAVKNSTDESYLKPVVSKYKKAIDKEREAFTYLLQKDLVNAEKAFSEVESIYPTFHQAYEISKYLKKNEDLFDDEIKIKDILNHIIKEFSWGAPKDLLIEIESMIE